jgi:hypothetical protein
VGRTTHFEISADGKNYRLDFPDVDFSKKVKWIQAWGLMQTRIVTVDWDRISRLLTIDNGIFYGRVQDLSFFQSLIISRRQGTLSGDSSGPNKADAKTFSEFILEEFNFEPATKWCA